MANLSNRVWAGGGTVLRDQQADRNVRSYERRHRAARQIRRSCVLAHGFGKVYLIHGDNELCAVGDGPFIADVETYSEFP